MMLKHKGNESTPPGHFHLLNGTERGQELNDYQVLSFACWIMKSKKQDPVTLPGIGRL